MKKLTNIYDILLKNFGHQGWWPLTISEDGPKHHSGRPKSDKHRFEIIIGAILTQNTNWSNVEKALVNLSKKNLIDVSKIDDIKKDKLAQLIRSSGYYNQKAERVKLFAKYIIDNYDSDILNFFNYKNINKKEKKSMKGLRQELLSLKGIGPETADSIILYSAEKPSFVIDAYTKRIFRRVFADEKGYSYDELKEIFENTLKKDVSVYKEYHALIVELAKKYCKVKPLCSACLLNSICRSKNKNI